jgi:adenylosuccinate synthase
MRRAIITVGLGFGDEGKGATVDYLARQHRADLVVRYCGGSQAGHNVQLADGRRHTFAQFGAGTLECIPTYLGPAVIIDPPAMRREARHLAELGVVDPARLLTIHPRCLVATVWHRTLNQLREIARGADRHGSCGQGIGEARRYWLAHGEDAVFAADLRDGHVLRTKLELLRQRMLLELQEFVDRVDNEALRDGELWELNSENEARCLAEAAASDLAITAKIPSCTTAIFEGAQGVLLDEYRGFPPYTTWSTVTPHHAWELVEQMSADEVTMIGVTRAYATRHGEGPLPTYCEEWTARLDDPGNPWNRWQGRLRCGWLDLVLLGYAAAAAGPLDGIAVNHLDQVPAMGASLCAAYRNATLALATVPDLAYQTRLTAMLSSAEPLLRPAAGADVVEALGTIAPVVVTGYGPTAQDRNGAALPCRGRRRVAEPEEKDTPRW